MKLIFGTIIIFGLSACGIPSAPVGPATIQIADIACKNNEGIFRIVPEKHLFWMGEIYCMNGAIFRFRNDEVLLPVKSSTHAEKD